MECVVPRDRVRAVCSSAKTVNDIAPMAMGANPFAPPWNKAIIKFTLWDHTKRGLGITLTNRQTHISDGCHWDLVASVNFWQTNIMMTYKRPLHCVKVSSSSTECVSNTFSNVLILGHDLCEVTSYLILLACGLLAVILLLALWAPGCWQGQPQILTHSFSATSPINWQTGHIVILLQVIELSSWKMKHRQLGLSLALPSFDVRNQNLVSTECQMLGM